MLINLHQALRFADEKGIALGSFNIYNVESLQAVLYASKGQAAPVILAFGEAYDKHMPLESMASLVKTYTKNTEQMFVLHLDHCRHLETIKRSLSCGFTSVMYDASANPLEKNIQQTQSVCALGHDYNSSVEGELGYMNEEDGSNNVENFLQHPTSVNDAKTYATKTNIDALAIAIGNAHGIYKGTPKLDLVRLKEIHAAVNVPLVLHGSSGIPHSILQKSIKLGIRKININTEISTTAIRASRQFLQEHQSPNTRFETMTKFAEGKMSDVVKNYLACFSLCKLSTQEK